MSFSLMAGFFGLTSCLNCWNYHEELGISCIIPLNCRKGGAGQLWETYLYYRQAEIQQQKTFLQNNLKIISILALEVMAFVDM